MVSIIVAASDNNVIGKDNKLIWKQSADLKRFKEITSNTNVIMGRKTYESIGRPLPNRVNIVVTRNEDLVLDGAIVVNSIEDALRKAPANKEIFIIGGDSIYKQSLKYTNNIYLTVIHEDFDGDTYFNSEKELLELGFKEEYRERFESDEKNEYDYSFVKYIR